MGWSGRALVLLAREAGKWRESQGARHVRELNTAIAVIGIDTLAETTRGALYLMLQNRIYRGEISRQPDQLSAKTLMHKSSRFPTAWTKQRALLGF